MNLRTTFILLILVGAGAVAWRLSRHETRTSTDDGTAAVPDSELSRKKLTKIEVQNAGRQLVLVRSSDSEWSLPGTWPTRKQAVDELVDVVAGLSSTRFVPLPLKKEFGLEQPAVQVIIWSGTQRHRLAFAEDPTESNRFSRPTYVQVDDRPEAIRLAPGLVSILQRPPDYYQQRRLFPSQRGAGADRLKAKSIAVKGPAGGYVLARKAEEWQLTGPVRDQADPDKVKAVVFS
ncbi:MAG TPA: DUF4340 domain-containing protein, partial [Gemmataceae bacterium]|nr:DUF4340 domain-containing protein [Gemmataceae bacterium]